MKTYIVVVQEAIFNSTAKVKATHFSESANMIYFYNSKDNITIDNVICAFPISRVLYIKELI